jgi:hypothetical protein
METGYEAVDWIQLAEDRVYWRAIACMGMNTFTPQ